MGYNEPNVEPGRVLSDEYENWANKPTTETVKLGVEITVAGLEEDIDEFLYNLDSLKLDLEDVIYNVLDEFNLQGLKINIRE